MNPVVIIPSRLAATRLPHKPMADIHGRPMIEHVWRRAMSAGVGPVIVACGDQPIVDAIRAIGGHAVLTDPGLPSGSDRVHAVLEQFDPDRQFDVAINLQGDLPTLDPAVLRAVLLPLADPLVDIATLAVPITDPDEIANPNVVKIALELAPRLRPGEATGRALYFSRQPIPGAGGVHYHHLGIYAYRRDALDRFVDAPPGQLELVEKLEQLRALALSMRIDAAVIDTIPLGVDTPADLERARAMLARSPHD